MKQIVRNVKEINYYMALKGKEKKMVIITGASRGIGNFLMDKFLHMGEEVIGTMNTSNPNGENSKYLQKVDIRNSDEVKTWIDSKDLNGKKIILINCAGINYSAFGHKADYHKWADIISVNLIGTFNVIRTVLPYMRENNFGRIINLSSVVPKLGVPGTSAYSASKAGLWGLTRTLAVESASKGITINTINLGYFNIGMIDQVPDEIKEGIKAKIPFSRFGEPQDIYKTINYLIETDYITGTSIDVNGGLI